MQCSQCHTDNKPGRRFCAACGSPLPLLCEHCGFANDPGDRFCGGCGVSLVVSAQLPVASPQPPNASPIHYTPPHLVERIRAEQTAMEARALPEGERKTITALFADIKGSMNLMEDLDPEEARALIDPALTVMMDAVHRYDGYVVQSTGDGIFAFFGAPIACEDHPQRALYAALHMQEEIKRYAETLRREKGLNFQIRVGLNTGDVVLRSIRKDDLHTEYTPIGYSTSLASRMESLATPGSIVVSEHTHKLTEGYFEFASLGAARVKGVSEPVTIYEVRGVGPLRTRLQIAARRGLVRFVGRQSELAQMKKAWELAQTGHGQIVAIVGGPGVGKSRLFHEFVGARHASPLRLQYNCLVLETFSVSHGKAYAYLPLIDLLKEYCQIAPQDEERRIREKVTGKVLTLDRSLEDTLAYLFTLLSVSEPNSSLQQMDPQIRRRRTLDAIKRLLVRESLNQPLMLIFEDLHWLDTETQAFLSLLSESLATARILLLVNYRPEYRHDWGNKTYYTQVRLDPLGKDEAQELLAALLGDSAALQPLQQFILAKTEGTPFFMEEMVQALFEQGVLVRAAGAHSGTPSLARSFVDLRLPSTVQGILTARIDRLGAEEKALLQTLAVIGKEFSLSLLKHVVEKSDDDLHLLLSRLQTAEFIYEQPAFPEPEYVFKHALTQEVAYNSVLIERRKVLHEQTGRALEALLHSRLEDHYNELAHHYSRSSNTHKAIEYLHLAGQQAVQRSANAEAISHFTTALGLLKIMPESPERIQQELALQTLLGSVLMATKGQAAPETGAAFSRAHELCQQIGETPHLFSVLSGLRRFYSGRRELQTARELAQQMLSLAQRTRDPALLVEAHHALGNVLFWSGEFVAAQEQVEQGIACHDPHQHRPLAFLYGLDPGVNCRNLAANVLWFLGYPDQALKRSPEALTLAQELTHPHSVAFALAFSAMLHQHRREVQATQEKAEALIALTTEHGFQVVVWGIVLRGWTLAERGQAEEGIVEIRQGLAAAQGTGTERLQRYYLTLLAEAHGKAGQIEEGLSVLAGLPVVEDDGEDFWKAEAYRLKGQLALQSQVPSLKSQVPSTQHPTPSTQAEAEAEACFLKAIDIARHQSAKSLELRATISLARLWQQQRKKNAARQLLAEIYGWFTEGFDTADLKEAKALLANLAAGPHVTHRKKRKSGEKRPARA
ncbi:MAG: AAA family ATPase, partial [Deltaproteobacteria bacterium]|nr:AAA family ATPase [Deltaproteobacteria bacterium]